MPSVIDEHLIENATPLPPGGTVRSRVVDVGGAQQVAVNVGITNTDAAVIRTIYFGRTTNNAFAPFRRDNFGIENNLSMAVPVCGPELFVIVENRGGQNHTVDGTVYAIRMIP
jgi:hypothetical protein